MLITYSSTVWQCRHCLAAMVEMTTPGGEPCIECVNPRCRWTVMAECRDILQTGISIRAEETARAYIATRAAQEQAFYYLLAVDGTFVVCNEAALLTTYPTLPASAILYGAPDVLPAARAA